MKELDVNTTLKNVIEEEKLQQELFKLSRSGTTTLLLFYSRTEFMDILNWFWF